MNSQDKELLMRAAEYSIAYMEGIRQKRAFPGKGQIDGLSFFDEALPEHGTEALQVIQLLHQYGAPATTAQTGGRFFGFVNGGLLPAAQAAFAVLQCGKPVFLGRCRWCDTGNERLCAKEKIKMTEVNENGKRSRII